MSLISILVTLIVLGVFLYLVTNFLPIEERFKKLIVWVAIIFVVVWLLMGLWPIIAAHDIHVG